MSMGNNSFVSAGMGGGGLGGRLGGGGGGKDILSRSILGQLSFALQKDGLQTARTPARLQKLSPG